MPSSGAPAPNGVSFDAMLRYNELETQRWRDWLGRQPDAVLDIPVGDEALGLGSVRGLLFHIAIVEWVYANVLQGDPWEDRWQRFDRGTLAGIGAVIDDAQPKLRAFAESASAEQLARPYTISSRGQTVSGTGTTFLTHIVLHSARHWAQLAMLLRQHGHRTDWQHDFVLSDAMK